MHNVGVELDISRLGTQGEVVVAIVCFRSFEMEFPFVQQTCEHPGNDEKGDVEKRKQKGPW